MKTLDVLIIVGAIAAVVVVWWYVSRKGADAGDDGELAGDDDAGDELEPENVYVQPGGPHRVIVRTNPDAVEG